MSAKRNTLDQADLYRAVQQYVDRHGTIGKAAASIGIKRQALSAQLNGTTPFSPKVLQAAGIRKIVSVHYEFIDD